jgi:hypothetical protein
MINRFHPPLDSTQERPEVLNSPSSVRRHSLSTGAKIIIVALDGDAPLNLRGN